MYLQPILTVLATLPVLSLANTSPASPVPCKEIRLRKEWRSLTVDQRKKYIKSVQCMLTKAPKSKAHFPIVTNRYEDFVALHANASAGGRDLRQSTGGFAGALGGFGGSMNTGIHGTGTFLPWHRYVVWQYESVLQDECGWDMGQPYWDWYLDTPAAGGSWLKSPLFDPESGFGGNGAKLKAGESGLKGFGAGFGTGGGCVVDGPFKDMKLHIGPGAVMKMGSERCLTRSFNIEAGEAAGSKEVVKDALASKDFQTLRMAVEMPNITFTGGKIERHGGGFHNVGHGGVGGEMGDPFTSINDPIFFLHHTGIDRVWQMWQDQDLQKRISDTGTGLTLKTPIWMGLEAPDRPVGDVMDIINRDGKGFLCYKYETGSEEYFDKPAASGKPAGPVTSTTSAMSTSSTTSTTIQAKSMTTARPPKAMGKGKGAVGPATSRN
ncbi:Di-copper centre-containing protein [Microthyrium microscopicum]|uniref:Di-copper centre-containing protein n=1 Tax=Microthyrium microscopicum TaxID=703497 RepID=A0A6A6UE26_9PEZI|nr:Di-copper centre-containing protein [Microthyrium microscopicum]